MILLKIIAVIFLLAKACETDGRPHSVFRHEKQFKKKLKQCGERVQKLGSQRTPLETNFSSLILDDMVSLRLLSGIRDSQSDQGTGSFSS